MSSLSTGPPTRPSFGERRSRADRLAAEQPAAAEALRFYAGLVALQESVVHANPRALLDGAAFADALDVDLVARELPGFVSAVVSVAPAQLRTALQGMGRDPARWRDSIEWHWQESDDRRSRSSVSRLGDPGSSVPGPGIRNPDPESFIVEALLQPFAEAAASRLEVQGAPGARCPVCGARPVVALLREEAHGARRSLVCGLCLTEWPTGRIQCQACGETRFERLPVFRADELPAARIDACDACRTYMKTVDLTKDATAIPAVDDIATLALDVWARAQGYRRLRPGLLRL